MSFKSTGIRFGVNNRRERYSYCLVCSKFLHSRSFQHVIVVMSLSGTVSIHIIIRASGLRRLAKRFRLCLPVNALCSLCLLPSSIMSLNTCIHNPFNLYAKSTKTSQELLNILYIHNHIKSIGSSSSATSVVISLCVSTVLCYSDL